jgi:Concanavalin A-like lectin/glucanases superfamily
VLPSSGDYDIFVKGSSTSSGGQIKVEIQINGQASCMFRGALGKKQIQSGPNLANGQWHHVICQRSGNQIVETVDGATSSFTKATGAITDTDPIRFGSHSGGGDWYRGLLDEVSYTIG